MRCCLATVVPLLRGGSWWRVVVLARRSAGCVVLLGVSFCWACRSAGRVVLLGVSSMAVERVRRVRAQYGRMVRCAALQCCLDGCFRRRCCEWASHAKTLRPGVPRQPRHAGSSQGLCRAFLRLQEKRRAGKRTSRTSCIVFDCCAKRGSPRFDTTWWI